VVEGEVLWLCELRDDAKGLQLRELHPPSRRQALLQEETLLEQVLHATT